MNPPPRVAASGGFARSPIATLRAAHERYGDVIEMDVAGVPTVVYGGRDGAAELFQAERAHLRVHNTDLVHELFGPAIFNLHSEEHRAARRTLRAGLGPEQLRHYAPTALRLAREHVRGWRLGSAPFDLYGGVRALTLDACAEVILGLPPTTGSASEASAASRAGFAAALDVFAAATELPSDERHGHSAYHAGLAAADQLLAVLREQINALRGRSASRGDSVLANVVRHIERSDADFSVLPYHLLAVLIAARETTASLITWLMVEVAAHPAVADGLRADALVLAADPAAMVDRAAAPALRAAMYEAERLHSPNTLSVRLVTADCCIGGYDLAAGRHVAYSPAANHRLVGACPRPDSFDPDSNMDGDLAAELLTFGRGLHACPGRGLAELLTGASAVAVFGEYRLAVIGGTPRAGRYFPVKAPEGPVYAQLEDLDVLRRVS